MKIRAKITLWIAAMVLFSTISFSVFLTFEMVNQHFRLIDNEIRTMANALTTALTHRDSNKTGAHDLPYNIDRYWVRVIDNAQEIIYESSMVDYVALPAPAPGTFISVEKHIPREKIRLGQDANDDVLFRVGSFTATISGKKARIIVGLPIENIEEEYIHLLKEYAVSFLLTGVMIVLLSYFLARRILQPVSTINTLMAEITQKTIDQRIPAPASKDEFYTLITTINRMFDRLQFSFKRQREFIGNAAHELKSPLTLLQLAQEEMLFNRNPPAEVKSDLEQQLKTTIRMSRLVRNLLDLSHLEQTTTITPTPVGLRELVGQVLEEYREVLSARGITAEQEINDDLTISGDREKLTRLLVNLIDNAIRYNLPQDGVIRVSGRRERSGVVLVIANRGRPIPPEERQRVFEQFYRVEKSRALTHGGTGLGLTIVKEIVELHDGTIDITGSDGWTQFELRFPGVLPRLRKK